MAAPAKPPKLEDDHTYIHITSHSDASSLQNAISSHVGLQAIQPVYLGPVGELKGEYIFELKHAGGEEPVKRSGEFWMENQVGLVKELKSLQGVKGAKLMEVKQRAKRGGEEL